jgi:hypothetical protein
MKIYFFIFSVVSVVWFLRIGLEVTGDDGQKEARTGSNRKKPEA